MVKKVVRRAEVKGHRHGFRVSGVLLIEAADNPRPVHKLCHETQHPIQDHHLESPRARPEPLPALPLENVSHFEGAGIYYGATFVEAQLCKGDEVIVVGGANSAGQAAVFLSESTKQVYLLVRGPGLNDTMSRYLIRRIAQTPNIRLLKHMEVVGLEGGDHLEHVLWRNNETGETERKDIKHVFLMTGAEPNTAWLNRCVALDEKGFIKTGPDLSSEDLNTAEWFLNRRPYLLEASIPGVFAVGGVHAGNIKRVASAVGECCFAITVVHQLLRE